ncbi:MAG TPA: YihY family inner membrane protein [Rudaea sp.]
MTAPPSARFFDRARTRAFVHFFWQRFLEERCLQAAGALAYTSLFALVPLIAAILGVLAAFPVFAQWRDTIASFMFANFVPAAGDVVQKYFTQFADNASKATAIGVLILVFSAVSLMLSIEDVFNRIWRVPSGRSRVSRFVMYWTVITLGPILFAAAIAISSYVLALPMIGDVEAQFSLKARLLGFAPFAIQWGALTAAYVLIPNRSVRLRDAMIGALLACVLFEAAKRGFTSYVTSGASYEQVYGALAIVPIFIFWIYLSWIDVLLGASLTATLAAFEYRAPDAPTLAPGEEFRGLLRVLQHFAAAQKQGALLSSADLLAREPFLTDDLVQRYLGDLDRAGLVQRTEKGGWALTRDLDSMSLFDLYAQTGYHLPLGSPMPGRTDGDALADSALSNARLGVRAALDRPLREIFSAGARSNDHPALKKA